MSLALLQRLAQRGAIRWLSYYFAEFINGQSGDEADPLLLHSAALVSEAHLDGDVCVELAAFAGARLFAEREGEIDSPSGIEADAWQTGLLNSACVGEAGDEAPLVVDRGRLYLYRYWRYEYGVAEHILGMLGEQPEHNDKLPPTVNAAGLDDDQKRAVARASRQRFSVISGGPGSGKTSTVVRILQSLLTDDPNLRVALTAPTGKAAARLMESIRSRVESADATSVTNLAGQAMTLHRLLGARGDRFTYGRSRRLAVDCVIVDEASMIDLKMMLRLLDALPTGARLILLGDRDQLASVAAGNVLGDITGHGHRLDHNSPPIAGVISLLGGAYRFGSDSPIGSLARHINAGDAAGVIDLLTSAPSALRWHQANEEAVNTELLTRIITAYQPIFEATDPLEALAAFDAFRVLCVTNTGPQGVARLNADISAALALGNNLGDGPIEHGQPILITRNHHQLGLYNGDTGILWRFDGMLHACFRSESGELRQFGAQRLSEYEHAWAVTVHKSQGSEYDTVVLMLGTDAAGEGLSREMLYTAVTRARAHFILQGGSELLARAVTRLTSRHSGLAARLGWPA